jgi:Transposase DDE domain
MTSMACLAETLQTLFTTTADRVGQESGFVQRRRKLTGSTFARALVFGFLDTADATLRQLQHLAALSGVVVSPQAIAQRCTETAATFLRCLLEEAVQTVVAGEAVAIPLLQRFPAVVVMDSTTITLPAVLREVWRGCGGSTPAAAAAVLKIQLRLELCRGGIDVFALEDGTASDQRAPSQTAPLPPGGLRLSDQGFFCLPVFRAVVAAGAHFLTRPVPRLTLQTGAGERLSLGRFLDGCCGGIVDRPVVVGAAECLPCRLIAVRVPAAIAERRRAKEQAEARREGRAPRASVLRLSSWTIVLTSLAPETLSVAEALVLLRLRWQVELVFKRWKSAGVEVTHWRTAKPWQALCTVYAKLLASLVAQWLAAVSCWEIPAKSLHAAFAATRGCACLLAATLGRSRRRLTATLRLVRTLLAATCRLQHRVRTPATFQLLADPGLQPLT